MDGFAQSLESEHHREQRSRSAGLGGNHTAITHRRPSSILKDLISSPQFGASNQALGIAGLGVTTVADFFVPFEKIGREHVGHFHGYWGAISHVRRGISDELWLNTHSRFDMSICIPRHMVEAFQMRFKMHCEWRRIGYHVATGRWPSLSARDP
jgi:hypothetical protein